MADILLEAFSLCPIHDESRHLILGKWDKTLRSLLVEVYTLVYR